MLRWLGALGDGGVLEACEPQHRALDPRNRITLARETGAEALALDTLMLMAYRTGYMQGLRQDSIDGYRQWITDNVRESLQAATDAVERLIQITAGGATARQGAEIARNALSGRSM